MVGPQEVTYVLDADAIREVVEQEIPEATDERKADAVRDILSAAEEIDLYSLAEYVVEATSIDLADYEPEED
jgi:hypothetical protein